MIELNILSSNFCMDGEDMLQGFETYTFKDFACNRVRDSFTTSVSISGAMLQNSIKTHEMFTILIGPFNFTQCKKLPLKFVNKTEIFSQ